MPRPASEGNDGDRTLVNGVIQPFFRVLRRKYRFRTLDATNARFFRLFLTDERGRSFPIVQIAHGGGLHSMPLTTENVESHPAERVEIVIDFAQFPGNTVLYLEQVLAVVRPDGADCRCRSLPRDARGRERPAVNHRTLATEACRSKSCARRLLP